MLNKYLPFFIVIGFIAMGCASSFPVTFHGVTFEDYIKGKRSQDSGYVAAVHPIHDKWQLVAVDQFRHNHMSGYTIEDLYLMLTLTNEEYIPERWEFSYPLYCHGKGITNGFTASYEFDNAGNIRFSNLSPTELASTPKKQVIEEWYFDALNTADFYLIGYSRPYFERGKSIKSSLWIYTKFGILIFKKYHSPSRQYEMQTRANQ